MPKLEAILKRAGSEEGWEFDRAVLQKAAEAEDVIEPEQRAQLYELVLLPRVAVDVPSTFQQYASPAAPLPTLDQGSPSTSTDQDAEASATAWEEQLTADLQKVLAGANAQSDCEPLVNSIGKEQLEAEITGMVRFLCEKLGRRYESEVVHVLGPLLCVGTLSLRTLFRLVYTVVNDYMPSVGSYKSAISEVLRLALQYHDPEVSLHLDRSHTDAGPYIVRWWSTMFSGLFNPEIVSGDVLGLWDWLFLHGDAMVGALLPIVFLMEKRRDLLCCSGKAEVAAFMEGFTAENIFASPKEVIQKAKMLHRNTPFSTRRLLRRILFPHSSTGSDHGTASSAPVPPPDGLRQHLLTFVALPVEAGEIVDTFQCADEISGVRPAHLNFVILDCRAEKSFNYARLPTAIHVGNDIGFDPKMLDAMVSRFDSARGSHLCILGTGRELEQELNLLKVIVLHFVQAGFRHVGFAEGGFKACIPFVKAGRIEVVRSPGVSPNPKKVPPPEVADPQPPTTSETTERMKHAAVEAGKAAQATKETVSKVAQKGMGWMKSWMGKKSTDTSSSTKTTIPPREEMASQPTTSSSVGQAPTPTGSSNGQPQRSSSSPEPSGGPEPKESTTVTTSKPQLYTLGDDDDDDFELITSVSPAPAPPAPAPAPAPTLDTAPAPATASGPSADGVASAQSEPQVDGGLEVHKASSSTDESATPNTKSTAPAPTTTPSPQSQPGAEHHPFDDIFV